MEYTVNCKDCGQKSEACLDRKEAFSRMKNHIRSNSCKDVWIKAV